MSFIILHRKILEWEWYDDANTMRLFLHCLLKANYEDKTWRGNAIKRGQFIASIARLSEELKLSNKQIRTSLDKLKRTNELASEGRTQHTVFTVINYNLYQDKGKRRASEGQAEGKRGATTNNNNNNNNNNKDTNDSSRKRSASKKKHSFPEDFQITDSMRDWFLKQNFIIELESSTDYWRDAMLKDQTKYQYTDWVAAWRNGMKNSDKWTRERSHNVSSISSKYKPLPRAGSEQ